MKKKIIVLMIAALCGLLSVPAFAEQLDTQKKTGKTTLTTVKEAAYVVVIPETAGITFDVIDNAIGNIEYQEGNLEPNATVKVGLTEQTKLANLADDRYQIEYAIQSGGVDFTSVTYTEQTQAGTKTPLSAYITKQAWDSAKSGAYEAKLMFTLTYSVPEKVQ